MTKVRLFSNRSAFDFIDDVNEFLKDKKLIDIKYQPIQVYDEYYGNGTPKRSTIYDRALIIYEEPGEDTSFQEDLDFFVNECTNAQLIALYKEVEKKMKEKGL